MVIAIPRRIPAGLPTEPPQLRSTSPACTRIALPFGASSLSRLTAPQDPDRLGRFPQASHPSTEGSTQDGPRRPWRAPGEPGGTPGGPGGDRPPESAPLAQASIRQCVTEFVSLRLQQLVLEACEHPRPAVGGPSLAEPASPVQRRSPGGSPEGGPEDTGRGNRPGGSRVRRAGGHVLRARGVRRGSLGRGARIPPHLRVPAPPPALSPLHDSPDLHGGHQYPDR